MPARLHREFQMHGGCKILALCVLCLLALLCHPLPGEEPIHSFDNVSEGHLVRRLQQTPIKMPDGLELTQQSHWRAQPPVLVIHSKLVNHSDRAIALANIPVADWKFGERDGAEVRFTPLTYRDDTWFGSTYWTGPDWTRVGKDWHHSGSRTSSIRRFVAPHDGQVMVRGRVYKADTNGGDGVRLEIRQGTHSRWKAEINGDDREGVEPDLTLQVRRGESIRFIVHRRGSIGYDTTHWDPTITYADGSRFQASQSFSPHRQGTDGWYYEMESDADADAKTPPRQPIIHAFGSELQPFHKTIQSSERVALTPSHALPLWILSNELDTSGVVVGLAPSVPWEFRCSQEDSHSFRIQLAAILRNAVLQPGKSLQLPPVFLAAYDGCWTSGSVLLEKLLSAEPRIPELTVVSDLLHRTARNVGIIEEDTSKLELDLATLVQLDWQQQDQLDESIDSYRSKTIAQLNRAESLRTDLGDKHALLLSDATTKELRRLKQNVDQAGLTLNDWRRLYVQTRWLKRRIALANPLLDFEQLLICKRVPTSYSHLVMQYYGWRARPGGSLFVVDRPGRSLSCRDILNGQLPPGNVLEPRLSYDGSRIVFSYVACREDGSRWDPAEVDNLVDEGFYHVWTVNTDGSGLRQITHGPYDDLMPCWLPDGGIAFSSTRRRGYARCFGGQFSQRWHVYTVHRMNEDGTDLRLLSAHDTNEWFPTVSNSGHILYSRWDYIDRDAVTHQNLWAMRPDGTNPIGVWGNATNSPHCTFQPQPVPNSNKIVFTASAHHSITGGSLALVDPTISNNGMAALTRLTPEIPFPEAEGRDIRQYYAAPWPLSEKYLLVAYSPEPLVWEPGANGSNALGIYLLDADGNRELIYRDPNIGSTNPCPLLPRPTPPVVPSLLAMNDTLGSDVSAADVAANNSDQGEMLLANVYEGLGDVPAGSIKQLRIIQIFPKTTVVADTPGPGTNTKNATEALVPRFGGRNRVEITPPGGQYGARGSRLMKLLRAGHYDVTLSPQELRRVAAWIDCNAIFYGAYRPEQQARQLRGETLAMPDVQ